jgi:hypothetical protein
MVTTRVRGLDLRSIRRSRGVIGRNHRSDTVLAIRRGHSTDRCRQTVTASNPISGRVAGQCAPAATPQVRPGRDRRRDNGTVGDPRMATLRAASNGAMTSPGRKMVMPRLVSNGRDLNLDRSSRTGMALAVSDGKETDRNSSGGTDLGHQIGQTPPVIGGGIPDRVRMLATVRPVSNGKAADPTREMGTAQPVRDRRTVGRRLGLVPGRRMATVPLVSRRMATVPLDSSGTATVPLDSSGEAADPTRETGMVRPVSNGRDPCLDLAAGLPRTTVTVRPVSSGEVADPTPEAGMVRPVSHGRDPRLQPGPDRRAITTRQVRGGRDPGGWDLSSGTSTGSHMAVAVGSGTDRELARTAGQVLKMGSGTGTDPARSRRTTLISRSGASRQADQGG